MLVEPTAPSDEELQLLRRRAMTHRILPGPVVFDSTHDGMRTTYKRPPAPMSRGSMEPVDNVISISRVSGRQRKMPGKFKEPVSPVWKHTSHRRVGSEPRRGRLLGLSRQNSRSILSVSKAPKAVRAGETPRAGEATEEADTGARVGDDYQAQVPGLPHPTDVGHDLGHDRADVLVWSASACPLPAAQLAAYVGSALPLLGGPPQDPPNQVPHGLAYSFAPHLTPARRMHGAAHPTHCRGPLAAQTGAHPCFPEEIAYHRLAASGCDPAAALAVLGASPPPPVDEWSKAEVRHAPSCCSGISDPSGASVEPF